MKTEWRVEFPQIAILVGMFAAATAAWPTLPDRLPVHWNAAGKVDAYGGKFEALLLMPIVALALYAAMRWIPRIDPGRKNYALFATAFGTLRISVIATCGALYAVMQLTYHGYPIAIGVVVPMIVGVLMILVGNVLGKVRPNWFVGIRTPWTMSSKTAWDKTHRAGGWMFIVAGLALMLNGALPVPWNGYEALAIPLALLLGVFTYSYWAWRNAPDKIPPAGTSAGVTGC